ncbi:MIP/aquaporin family protein [Pseudofulvibacter geojedonensis]|uniref:MIP/aquaporin family protein n=1 Tax=Pseudofulvibacter geojedonensis TaxID=1123758 RepID=A0ABW3HZC6_9FLAO
MNLKQYIAELIGTFTLVFCGCGAIVTNEFSNGTVTHSGIALTFGLIVMALIYAFGEISGAHFNPAVTIAFTYAKKFPLKEVPKYILAQCTGAIAAAGLLLIFFPTNELLGTTLPSIDTWRVFLFEVILTFFLMLVIINVSTGSKETGIMAGIAIGAVVWLEAQFAGPITGASMNPARSIGPALVSGHLEHIWIYIFAPIIGAVLAVISCKLVKDDQCCDSKC